MVIFQQTIRNIGNHLFFYGEQDSALGLCVLAASEIIIGGRWDGA
jgi:hypothetical protein